jgi:uncharacterized protein YceH (UPF0502 family)
MPTLLSDVEARVLGSLIEKQVTTPEYYPLTLNSLTLACNQKNNRNPVTGYDEVAVTRALESLREKNLVYVFYGSNSRVPKYKHVAPEVLEVNPQELALVCVLLLRGYQTLGELKDRAARLYEFSNLEEVEQTLTALSSREPEPMVARLPRQAGQKEARFAHLLCGEPQKDLAADNEPPPRRTGRIGEVERVLALEEEVLSLRASVLELQQQFEEFKKQFD